jgi:hypothetical protein
MRSRYSGTSDINDHKPWSLSDLQDLHATLNHGSTIEETAFAFVR